MVLWFVAYMPHACNMHKMSSGFQYLQKCSSLSLRAEIMVIFGIIRIWNGWHQRSLRSFELLQFRWCRWAWFFHSEHHNMKTVRKVSLANKKRGVKVAIIYWCSTAKKCCSNSDAKNGIIFSEKLPRLHAKLRIFCSILQHILSTFRTLKPELQNSLFLQIVGG